MVWLCVVYNQGQASAWQAERQGPAPRWSNSFVIPL